ncbi:MAG TPA: YibE/F family protein [Acidimicrobiaceae bacterium]|nr:YibE/F family protein [Acidimicrobiaceae bacterium]
MVAERLMERENHGSTSPSHSHSHSQFASLAKLGLGRSLTLKCMVAALVSAGALTVFGLIALWPSQERSNEVRTNAQEIGLTFELLEATVYQSSEADCGYSLSGELELCRNVTVVLDEGTESGSLVALPEANIAFDPSFPKLSVGESIIVALDPLTGSYHYEDRERLNALWWLLALFVVIVVAFARFRGALALVAMAGTVLILIKFVAPSVLDGNDPVLVCAVAASAIAFFSLYLTHGANIMTTVALTGTLIALALTLAISSVFFELAKFSGFASEEAFILPYLAEGLDVRGLLLGGTIIAALGALDDVTITQAATVLELKTQSGGLSAKELMASGLRVGREHIASTVNTLLLAYVGSSIPLLLLFAVSDQTLSEVANSELIAVEIVRTLCGSVGLVAALPLTTFLAAFLVRSPKGKTHEPDVE